MPATLEDALTIANQIQTVEEAQKRLQKDRSQMETCELGDSTSNGISGGETNSLEERHLPEQLKRTEAIVLQLAKQVQQLLSEQSTGKQRVSQAGTWGDRRQKGPQQGLVCWACGKQGHIKEIVLHEKAPRRRLCLRQSSSFFVFGYIAGHHTKMLVDTGSAVTIVRENVWEEAGCDSLESPVRKLVTANGQEMELAGQGEEEMKIGDLTIRHVVLVTETLTHDCLLGADFLTAHGCVVDLQRNVVLIAGKAVPLACKSMQMRTGCVM